MVIAVMVGVRLDAGAVIGEGEKVVLLRHVAVNRTGIRDTGSKARQGLEVVLDGHDVADYLVMRYWFPTISHC